jgi:DNA-binding response OmpR family regulator
MIGARILLVDDEILIRQLLAEVLRDAGFDVVEARNADEAMRLLRDNERIDILLTDVQMPGNLDGVDLARNARHDHADMPVMIISAYMHRVIHRIKGMTPAPLLVDKPYRLHDVADQVQQLAVSLP